MLLGEEINGLVERAVFGMAVTAQIADGDVTLNVPHPLAMTLGYLVGPLFDQDFAKR